MAVGDTTKTVVGSHARHLRPPVIVASAGLGLAIGALTCDSVDPTHGALERRLAPELRPALPDAAAEAYERFVDACRQRDALAVWQAFSPDLRRDVDRNAQEVAATASATRLADEYGYSGHVAGFDGTAYLQGVIAAGGETSPCEHADLWRRVQAGPDGDAWIIVVERATRETQGIRLVDDGGTWRVGDLSRVIPADQQP